MTPAVLDQVERAAGVTIEDLIHRHHQAARQKDEKTRKRLFDLIEEMEWAYPEALSALRAARKEG